MAQQERQHGSLEQLCRAQAWQADNVTALKMMDEMRLQGKPPSVAALYPPGIEMLLGFRRVTEC